MNQESLIKERKEILDSIKSAFNKLTNISESESEKFKDGMALSIRLLGEHTRRPEQLQRGYFVSRTRAHVDPIYKYKWSKLKLNYSI